MFINNNFYSFGMRIKKINPPKTRKQLEKIVVDMNYSGVVAFGNGGNGSFLSLVRPLPREAVLRYDQMVGRYRRFNYSFQQLEKAIAIREGLNGIEIVELMAYLRPVNKPKQRYSRKGRYVSA